MPSAINYQVYRRQCRTTTTTTNGTVSKPAVSHQTCIQALHQLMMLSWCSHALETVAATRCKHNNVMICDVCNTTLGFKWQVTHHRHHHHHYHHHYHQGVLCLVNTVCIKYIQTAKHSQMYWITDTVFCVDISSKQLNAFEESHNLLLIIFLG